MVQWAPDTSPDRAPGGGYTFADTRLFGYSLTHISGPGCGGAGDGPLPPLAGAFPADGQGTPAPSTFSPAGETAPARHHSAVTTPGGAGPPPPAAPPPTPPPPFLHPPPP